MSRDAYDFLDAIDAKVEKERRDRMVVEAQAQMRADAEKAAEAKARVDATTRRANESHLKTEFARAGVEPPFVDARGVPTVSLSLLLKNGWSVERLGQEIALVRPTTIAPARFHSEVGK